jgi:hypothetical protein
LPGVAPDPTFVVLAIWFSEVIGVRESLTNSWTLVSSDVTDAAKSLAGSASETLTVELNGKVTGTCVWPFPDATETMLQLPSSTVMGYDVPSAAVTVKLKGVPGATAVEPETVILQIFRLPGSADSSWK